ncbi:TPA: replication initiator protein A [Streptococcus pneumoniae]|nr:replication initiator protein A [Streptococcus pneumoniae]
MSFKNNWIDKEGRVFIYFTVEEIMKRRNISKPTAIKTLDELDIKKRNRTDRKSKAWTW